MRLRVISFIVKHRLASLLGNIIFPLFDRLRIRHAILKGFPLPLPEIGIHKGGIVISAGEGLMSFERWRLIQSSLPKNCRTAIDIGSNNGFFTLRLANEGIFAIGFEPDTELLQLAVVAACRNQEKLVAFSSLAITPDNVCSLPSVDITLMLSVAQRWVHQYGRDGMEKIIKEIWSKTERTMFFEIPNPVQSTKESKWLDFLGETEEKVEESIEYLLRDIGAEKIELLGYLPTDFRPDEKRHLFVVHKQ
ncbi:MAG: hypothetical protein LBK67_13080 [Coriobacteriales bacterium]|jgi:hypothetical protein|nr:hypothetical protein [Coriobacteriales bacterium]